MSEAFAAILLDCGIKLSVLLDSDGVSIDVNTGHPLEGGMNLPLTPSQADALADAIRAAAAKAREEAE